MNIFQRAVKSFADVVNPSQNKLLHAIYQWQVHSGVASPLQDNNDSYLTNGYAGNATVYSIINRIIQMASQARLALYTKDIKGKWIEMNGHELNLFIDTANPTMAMSEFLQGHLIYKLSIGNSYWYKPVLDVGINKGKAKELWLMPSNNVEILGGTNWMNPVGGYQLNTNTLIPFTVEEVYHSKFFNPLFGTEKSLYGQSPLKAAARIVSKQNEAENTELKQFTNQAPPYLLYKDSNDPMGNLTRQQADSLEEDFANYNKKFRTGLPKVLTDKFGMLKLGVSPVDLGILESSQEGRRILCSIYGIQSELLNDKASSTYNNVVEIKKDAWNNCLRPNLDNFAAGLNSFLIRPVPEYAKAGLFFAFDYSTISELQVDLAKNVTWMRQAYWTPNEIRDATGLAPVVNPVMDEPWFSMGESPLSEAAAPPPELVVPPVLKNLGDYK